MNESGTEVDDARAGIDALDNGVGKFFRSRARHLDVAVRCFGKNRAQEQRATGTDRRRNGAPPGRKYTGHKSPVRARNTVSDAACDSSISRKFTDRRPGEVWIIQGDS